jgi:hypothetical protein
MILALTVPLSAQTVIEGRIEEVRFDQPQGIHLTDSSQPFIEVAPLTLDSPGTTILDKDERRIALRELEKGAMVTISGELQGTVLIATEIRVTASVEHRSFGGVIIEIRGKELLFARDHGEWVDRNVEVTVEGEPFGSGLDAVIDYLERTDGPISVTLSDQNPNGGKFRRAEFFQAVSVGKRWEENQVTIQVIPSADAIRDSHEEGFLLRPVQTVFLLPQATEVWDHSDRDFPDSEPRDLSILEPFMSVYVSVQVAGETIVNANININDRPTFATLDLRIGYVNSGNDRIGFDAGSSIRLLPNARIFDTFGNPLAGLQQFTDMQYDDRNSVALISLNSSGMGIEARLVPFDELGPIGSNQVVIGAVFGIHRGFWSNSGERELGTHSLDGILLPGVSIVDSQGQPVPMGLLNDGIRGSVTGALVSGQLFIESMTIEGVVTPFELTTRIEDFDSNQGGGWMRFEQSNPIRIDPNVEVFDHFGGQASLQAIQELFERGDIQLRLTMGEIANDQSRFVVRIESFRHDDLVDEGADQEIITSGRLEPWSQPALLFPQAIRRVQISRETELIGQNGEPLRLDQMERGARVQVTGSSITLATPGRNGERVQNSVSRIEILGGAATQFRGFIAERRGDTLIFDEPAPLYFTPHSDIQEETGFRIDLFTLASRIEYEGGLRMWVGAEFGQAEGSDIWWARVMHPNEPSPPRLGNNESIARVVGVDTESRALIREPIPNILVTAETEIRSKNGGIVALEDIIEGARVTATTEDRGGSPVAIEIIVDAIPRRFRFTAPVDYVDHNDRRIEFAIPSYMMVDPNAEILGVDGDIIDLAELRARLQDQQVADRLLRVHVAPDSPTDAPIVERIRMIGGDLVSGADGVALILFIDEPQYRIRVFDRRIEPTPLPGVRILEDAVITGLDGSPIDFHDLDQGTLIEVIGTDSDGRLAISEVRVLGGNVFVEEGTIERVDVANRLIFPDADPSQHIDPHAYIVDTFGNKIDLASAARIIEENDDEDLLLVVENNPFGEGLVSLSFLNPDFGRPPGHNEQMLWAEEVKIDVAKRLLLFRPPPPARVAEDAVLTGVDGETLTIEDLVPGDHAFVRGEELGDDIVITAITLIPQIDRGDLVAETGDFNDDGVGNDVIIEMRDQNGRPIQLPLRVFVDFKQPFETRSGHILTNLPAGPHIIRVEVVSRPEIRDQARVFIAERASTLSVLETFPEDGATGIPVATELRITFSEAVQQVGDYISVEGNIHPEPLTSGEDTSFKLDEDGTILLVQNVVFEENTTYTITISSATSRNGSVMTDPIHVQFSTGQSLLELGGLAGSISLDADLRFVGTVRLFNKEGEQVQEAPILEDGNFMFNALFEGTYRFVADATTEDGQSISKVYEDYIKIGPGEVIDEFHIILEVPNTDGLVDGEGNTGALVQLDLDTRSGNQSLGHSSALPDADVHVVVYAIDVEDIVGFSLSLAYDSTAVSFVGVDEGTSDETNFLRRNSGLVVMLPPTVAGGSVDFAGAILAASDAQAVSGEGVLGVFRFKTKNSFVTSTEFLAVSSVGTASQSITALPLARASIELATQRILLGLVANPDTIRADGRTRSALRVDLKDADGNPIAESTSVRFEIVSGTGTISQTEVVASGGEVEVDLYSSSAGLVTVEVSVDGASPERVSVFLEAPLVVGIGAVGPIALDLDLDAGDQGRRETANLETGDEVTVELVLTDDLAEGLAGFEVLLLYDESMLGFSRFDVGPVFEGAVPITSTPTDSLKISAAMLGNTATLSSGTLGQVVFKIIDGFSDEVFIRLDRGSFGGPEGTFALDIGPGGAMIRLAGRTGLTPDFDGDGEVGFGDFVQFAGVFGSQDGDDRYDSRFDLDGSGDIGFPDFVTFAQAFGGPVPKRVPRSKFAGPVELHQATRFVEDGTVEFDLSIPNWIAGYDLTIVYDPASLQIVDITSQLASLLTTGSRPAMAVESTPGSLRLTDYGSEWHNEEPFVTLIARSISSGLPALEIIDASVSTELGVREASVVHHTSDRPMSTELGRNFPNPFNPETVIPFALAQGGRVQIVVYNVLGQEVVRLVDDHYAIGRHTVAWNGKDTVGRPASSGLYFLRMLTDGAKATRKMALVK